jgi:hypothetical protein
MGYYPRATFLRFFTLKPVAPLRVHYLSSTRSKFIKNSKVPPTSSSFLGTPCCVSASYKDGTLLRVIYVRVYV